ncbi:MAG: hypothetical protein LBQ60_21105, partial [Bacteroidales bacterium]|nr:hypothetical protein [Bacteroidales bacterium]
MEIKKDNPIELRNEEIEAILGRTPNSLVRNGIMVIFGVMILILGSTFFFSYPDSIHCRIIITSSNPPVHLIAQTSGHIQNLVVVNHQKVKTDQLLAILENPADVRDMLILETFIDSIKKNDIKPGCIHFEPQRLRLGDVLPYFLEFQKALAEFESFEELRYHPQKLEAMRHQIELTIAYRERLKGQLQLMEQDMAIEQKNYGRDSSLRQ